MKEQTMLKVGDEVCMMRGFMPHSEKLVVEDDGVLIESTWARKAR